MYYFVLLGLSLLQLVAISVIIGMIFMRRNAGRRYLLGAALALGVLTSIFMLLFLGAYNVPGGGFYNGYYYPLLVASIGTVLIAFMLAYSYVSRPCLFIGLMLLLIYGLFIYGAMGRFAYGIGVFGIGTAYGQMYRESAAAKGSNRNKKTYEVGIETSRDVLQIGLGVIVMLVLALGRMGVPMLVVLIIAAYALNNSLPNLKRHGALYSMLRRFERRGSTYGSGAIYILAGTAMLVGFISGAAFLEVSIAILFIGDALATIFGMRFGFAKLPYVSRKTLGGFLAFALVGAVSFYAIGEGAVLSIVLAIVVAFVESVSSRFDDNVTVPAALIALFYVLF
ncbi:MAG: hypothetical protein ACP5UH_00320 [Candidatus Micrarchaeia archaeon]